MKKTALIILLFLGLVSENSFAQEKQPITGKYTAHNKGKFYFYWGGNRDNYTKSDIHLVGKDYDFTLHDVKAVDKPKGWSIDYINPTTMTIPQTNFKIGYYINDHYNISVGVDHMKYQVFQNQVVRIGGAIGSTYPDYQGSYTEMGNHSIDLSDGKFLTFQHCDGLNYVNAEVARVDDLSKMLGLPNTDKFQISITEGLGGGVMYPDTEAVVMGDERHHDFHVSGFGASAKAGLNFTFFKYFFIQTELKAGYINMPYIKTGIDPADKGSQEFMFLERIIAFGGIFKI